LESGYIDQILLSQDVFVKSNLRAYGGWGYDHILTNVVPMLRRIGITDDQIHTMMAKNPEKVLSV
jgi:phosphotriesterase-related protein